ncbi:hypothetical protein BGZ59_004682 [Podila verticillata]|nr:hypothetical protein BGZ59_004682 [Podila verticillata]
MTAPAANAAPTTSTNDDAKVAQEVGMMFAHEYYTFLNKEPSRLHCFYNKNSTLSHGLQGESVDAIHSKILDLDFEDCKVLVSNVDCQRSLDGSIIIQVLGELSNRGGPAQKFAQTFFLAVQPKGFYVLNDIFRYLKDDIDEYYEEAEEEQEHIQEAQEAEAEAEPEVQEPKSEVVVAVAIVEPVAAEAPIEEAVVEKVEVEEEKEKTPAPETKKSEKKDKKSDKKSEKKDKKETKKEEPEKKEEVAVETPTPISAPVEPTPVLEAPVPPKPAAPKTWANLAANNSTQWGSHVSGAKATSVNVLPTPAPKPTPTQAPKPVSTHRPSGREEYHSIYIKNVTDKMTLDQLREAFAHFGTVKHLELTRGKTCAFLDFATSEAMHAALKQNTVRVGSETVLAEERHRSNSNVPQTRRPFNNTTNGHGPQGAHRGRGGSIRGGASDRKPASRPSEKSSPAVAVK